MRYSYHHGVSNETPSKFAIIVSTTVTALLIAFVTVAQNASAATATVYDATPSTLPPNVASLGYEATSTSEFGDYVHLSGVERSLNSITVTMSNWAKYSEYSSDGRYSADTATWSHPVTVNVYSSHLGADGQPDELLASKTQMISIPWRPEADPTCAGSTAWRASDGNCYNGIAFNAVFSMSSLAATLPDDVIVGVAYSTQHYGASPVGVTGPYNSLNVAIPNNQTATVGQDDDADEVFWDTTYPGYDGGFELDSNWAPNGTVAFKITTGTASPTSKDECKNGGWMNLVDKNSNSFKNQGQCVASVQSSENSKLNRQ